MTEEYVLPSQERVSMAQADADRLLREGDGDAALLYLYILRNGGRFDAREAAKLRLSKPLDACMRDLQALGLVRAKNSPGAPAQEAPKPKPPLEREDAPPEYSMADVKRNIDAGSAFGPLLNDVAERLGRVLSGGDMMILFGIYDYLGLSPEVILLLIGWCVGEQERRYGAGKRPSLRQIEKEAYVWARSELYTLDAAETYLREREERRTKSAEVRRCLGIRDRLLSPTEEKYVMSWLELGFGSDAIAEAYDRTIVNKKELVWPYMNRILESWHKKNLHTPAEIAAGDGKNRAERAQARPAASGPDAAEYERMQKYVDKLNGGEGNGA